MNFTFVNSTVRFSLLIHIFRKSINIKTLSLSGSRLVSEAFLKSFSIFLSGNNQPNSLLYDRAKHTSKLSLALMQGWRGDATSSGTNSSTL